MVLQKHSFYGNSSREFVVKAILLQCNMIAFAMQSDNYSLTLPSF